MLDICQKWNEATSLRLPLLSEKFTIFVTNGNEYKQNTYQANLNLCLEMYRLAFPGNNDLDHDR